MILYTGIGSKVSGIHTQDEFLDIMFKTINLINYPLEWNGYELPQDFEIFSVDDWVEFSGAIKM